MDLKSTKLITASIQLAGLLLLIFVAMGAQASPCATTPEAAVAGWFQQQESTPGTGRDVDPNASAGYAVERIMVDSSLGNRWAIVMDCLHPERPVLAVALPAEQSSARTSRMHPTISPAGPPPRSSLVIAVPHPAAAHITVPPRKVVLSSDTPMLVRAGDPVVLWNREPQLLLEVAAIALEYGHAGQVIHLRRTGQLATPTTTLTGVVRAAGSVELMP